ncbi:MAG TPA: DUF2975 domain-containing protein [Pyrinomonadaceae bacterium]|nr:DUF2975 domain-containing protein [Pyrinomonadaceae bacterium]
MKRGSTIFLQVVIAFIGLGVLAFLIFLPQVEGRNANATQFEIYFKDPFLAYIYLASAPFFVALYQAIKMLGYAGRDEIFQPSAVRALRIIKCCAIAVILFFVGAEAYIFIFVRGTDDVAGGVMMGFFVIIISAVIATAAAVFERVLQNAVDIKSENDLTV